MAWSSAAEILFSSSFRQVAGESRKMAARRRQQRKLTLKGAFSGSRETTDSRCSRCCALASSQAGPGGGGDFPARMSGIFFSA